MSQYVLDASALLALIHKQPGAATVEKALPSGIISAVSFSECVSELLALGIPLQEVESILMLLLADIVPFTTEQAFEVAHLKMNPQAAELSFPALASLALAKLKALPILTAHPDWVKLDCGVEICSIH